VSSAITAASAACSGVAAAAKVSSVAWLRMPRTAVGVAPS
jgi:hypothetical protein